MRADPLRDARVAFIAAAWAVGRDTKLGDLTHDEIEAICRAVIGSLRDAVTVFGSGSPAIFWRDTVNSIIAPANPLTTQGTPHE